MRAKIMDCFKAIGIIVEETDDNFRVDDYIQDSLTFISLIVELEDAFNIEIPDEYLAEGKLKTFDDIHNMLSEYSTMNSEI